MYHMAIDTTRLALILPWVQTDIIGAALRLTIRPRTFQILFFNRQLSIISRMLIYHVHLTLAVLKRNKSVTKKYLLSCSRIRKRMESFVKMIRYARGDIDYRAMGRDYHRVPLLSFQETKHFQLQKGFS